MLLNYISIILVLCTFNFYVEQHRVVSEMQDRGNTHNAFLFWRNRYEVLSFSGFMSECSQYQAHLTPLALFLSTSLEDTLRRLHFAVL